MRRECTRLSGSESASNNNTKRRVNANTRDNQNKKTPNNENKNTNNTDNRLPAETWKTLSKEQQRMWRGAMNKENGTQSATQTNSSTKNYGKQYSRSSNKATQDKPDEKEENNNNTNIWTTVTPKTSNNTRKSSVNLLVSKPSNTIKVIPFKVRHTVCIGIKLGNTPEIYNVWLKDRHSGEEFSVHMAEARAKYGAETARYIMSNNLEILPDLSWATVYYPIKRKGKKGKPLVFKKKEPKAPEHAFLKLYSRLKQVNRKKNNTLINEKVKSYVYAVKRSKKPKTINDLTNEEFDGIIREFSELHIPQESLNTPERQLMQNRTYPDIGDTDVAILDSGCDTCAIGGKSWIIEERTGNTICITGHTENTTTRNNVEIVSAITAVELPHGQTIIIKLNECSNLGYTGNTLLSTAQMREHGVEIRDKPARHGGKPHLQVDGYVIPLTMSRALMQFPIRRPTRAEQRSCPTVELTSAIPWDPTIHHDEQMDPDDYMALCNAIPDCDDLRQVYLAWSRHLPQNVTKVAPYLLHPGKLTTENTLKATTQLGTISTRIPLRPHIRSRNPLLTCKRFMEDYATDTWYFSPRSYEGFTCCQLFYGLKSKRIANYGMKTESHGPDALLDFFREEGVPISIRRDNSKMQTGYLWKQLMRRYNCKDQFTEPHNPQQNPAERAIGEVKTTIKKTYIDTGCHPKAWYRLVQHVIDVKNHTALESLNWRTPLELSTGQTPDISGLLYFKFWEDIYYYEPTDRNERLGKWLGRAHSYGDTMAYWILTSETNELIVRGTVRSATDTDRPNLQLGTTFQVKGETGEVNSLENFPMLEPTNLLPFLNTLTK